MRSTRSPLGRVKAWYSRSSMGLLTTAADALMLEEAARDALGMGRAARERSRVLSPVFRVDLKWCWRLRGVDDRLHHLLPMLLGDMNPPQQLRRSIVPAMSTRDMSMGRAAAGIETTG